MVSEHTKLIQFQERLAKGLIWGAAGITMGILMLIVGFVIVNGLYTREEKAREVLPVKEEVISFSDTAGSFKIAAGKKIRLSQLSYGDIREIYQGLNSFWGYLSGQNESIIAAVYADPLFRERLSNYLFGRPQGFSKKILSFNNIQEAETLAKNHKGILMIYPGEWDVPQGGRPVELQQWAIGVNPDVTQLESGRRLSKLHWGQGEVEDLLAGSFTQWEELGGPSGLPVSVISQDLPPEEKASALKTMSGSVALVRQRDVYQYDLTILEVISVNHRLNLRPSFLFEAPSRAGAVGGISTIIINTLILVAFVLLIATPLGLMGAVYLQEYARQGRAMAVLRVGIDTLAGIPSIIFGLFGFVFFSTFLGLKTGLLSGTFTLTLMILPTIVRTSEEAISSVPQDLRHASMALGATKHQTIWQIVIPAASPGILTGVILGLGRAVGETAALLFTLGSNLALIKSFNSPVRVLSVHLYMLIRENISIPNAFGTATILIIIVFLVNFITRRLIGRMSYGAK